MGMVVFLYAPINVSYSAPNEDIYLHLAPFRSKCCQLDVPFLINWAFAQQLGVLIPQRVAACFTESLFTISYLEVQVTWHFPSKSLDHFLSSLQMTWKPSHLAKSQVTSVADLQISWITLTSLFVICIFLKCIIMSYISQYMYIRQSELSSLISYVSMPQAPTAS